MRLALRVQPGAKRTALVSRLASGEWKVAVSAPPSDGRANEAVLELVSDLLGVKRRQVALLRGESSRGKLVEVEGIDEAAALARLAAALPGPSARVGGKDDDGE